MKSNHDTQTLITSKLSHLFVGPSFVFSMYAILGFWLSFLPVVLLSYLILKFDKHILLTLSMLLFAV